MEVIEILDSNGLPTGEIETKEAIHQNGYWHKTVHVWLLNSKNELLLQKRSHNIDSFPGYWDIFSAGHVMAGENSIVAAKRELGEELLVSLSDESFEYLFTIKQQVVINNGRYINNEISDVFLVQSDIDNNVFNLQKEEVETVKFVKIDEFKKMLKTDKEKIVPHLAEYQRLFKILAERVDSSG